MSEEPACGVLGDVLWATAQLAPNSNTDIIVVLALIKSDPFGMVFDQLQSRVLRRLLESSIVPKFAGGFG